MTYSDETAASTRRTSIGVEMPSLLQPFVGCVADVFVMTNLYTCVLLQLSHLHDNVSMNMTRPRFETSDPHRRNASTVGRRLIDWFELSLIKKNLPNNDYERLLVHET